MPTRTISNTGGSYNATASWVEGVVPTSADDIVATATSGQLTINIGAAARTIDLTNYANTITLNADWTVSGAGLSNIIAVTGMTYSGTGRLTFSATQTLSQTGTVRVANLRFTSSNTKTISSDIYCNNFAIGGSCVINGNRIFVGGNLGDNTATTIDAIRAQGTTNYTIDGSGYVSYNYSGTGTMSFNSSGTYNTVGVGFSIGNDNYTSTPTINILNIGTPSLFNIVLLKSTLNDNTYNINSTVNTPNFFVSTSAVNNAGPNLTLQTTSGIMCNLFGIYPNSRPFTTDNAIPDVRISGGTFSPTILNLTPTYRTTSSGTNPPAASAFTYRAPTLRLDPLYTHNIGVMKLSGGGSPDRPEIRSTSTSSVPINLLSRTASQIIDYNFTDVNAVGQQIVAINGTFSNVTNVTNVYPTSTGGGGGSFTFVN